MILTLEQQVCSVESAKRLKELGCRQESFFYWCDKQLHVKTAMGYSTLGCESPMCTPDVILDEEYYEYFEKHPVSAYTVAELGEMLPKNLDGDKLRIFRFQNGAWEIWYSTTPPINPIVEEIEAEARALMLIYLIEQGLIDAKTL